MESGGEGWGSTSVGWGSGSVGWGGGSKGWGGAGSSVGKLADIKGSSSIGENRGGSSDQFLVNVGLSWDLLVDVGLSGDLFVDVRLSGDFLVDVGLSRDLFVDVGLSGDFLVKVGLSKRVNLTSIVVWVDGKDGLGGIIDWGGSIVQAKGGCGIWSCSIRSSGIGSCSIVESIG